MTCDAHSMCYFLGVYHRLFFYYSGWLGGGSTESMPASSEPVIRTEVLSMRNGIYDTQRHGTFVAISPDRRLAAFADNLGRVAVLDISSGFLIKLFKGYRDAQCAFVQVIAKLFIDGRELLCCISFQLTLSRKV